MKNALGIDLEEWYHLCDLDFPTDISTEFESRIEEQVDRFLEILDLMQTRCTFFVLGVIAEVYPGLIRKIDCAGHEIASHGYRHIPLYHHTKESFRQDLKKSIEILSSLSRKPIEGFRAPNFSIRKDTLWAFEVLSEEGIRYDCSVFPIRHPRYGLVSAPRILYRVNDDFTEFPLSTTRFFGNNIAIGGGAYFRILPYWFIRQSLKELNGQNIIGNFYIHSWEIDDFQPKLKMPFSRFLSRYTGLKNAEKKIRKLLTEFQFAPVGEIIKNENF